MLRDFVEFLRAVLNQWQLLVTGGFITAVLAWIQARREKAFSWKFTRRLYAFFLVLALFLAWRDERRDQIGYQQQLNNPTASLVAATDESFIYNHGQGKWILILLLNLTNVGKNQTIAHGFELNIPCPDKNELGVRPPNLPKASQLQFWDLGNNTILRLLSDEFIENRMASRAIGVGDLVRGWMVFEVEINLPLSCKYMLSFRDTFGRIYFLQLPSVEKIPPAPKRLITYPSISTPFIDKSIAKTVP